MPAHGGNGLGRGVLPGLHLNIGDATTHLFQVGRHIGGLGAARPEVFYGDINSLMGAVSGVIQAQLGQGR
jgi:hypothetical protein